jgi:hypothetical protein
MPYASQFIAIRHQAAPLLLTDEDPLIAMKLR